MTLKRSRTGDRHDEGLHFRGPLIAAIAVIVLCACQQQSSTATVETGNPAQPTGNTSGKANVWSEAVREEAALSAMGTRGLELLGPPGPEQHSYLSTCMQAEKQGGLGAIAGTGMPDVAVQGFCACYAAGFMDEKSPSRMDLGELTDMVKSPAAYLSAARQFESNAGNTANGFMGMGFALGISNVCHEEHLEPSTRLAKQLHKEMLAIERSTSLTPEVEAAISGIADRHADATVVRCKVTEPFVPGNAEVLYALSPAQGKAFVTTVLDTPQAELAELKRLIAYGDYYLEVPGTDPDFKTGYLTRFDAIAGEHAVDYMKQDWRLTDQGDYLRVENPTQVASGQPSAEESDRQQRIVQATQHIEAARQGAASSLSAKQSDLDKARDYCAGQANYPGCFDAANWSDEIARTQAQGEAEIRLAEAELTAVHASPQATPDVYTQYTCLYRGAGHGSSTSYITLEPAVCNGDTPGRKDRTTVIERDFHSCDKVVPKGDAGQYLVSTLRQTQLAFDALGVLVRQEEQRRADAKAAKRKF